MTPLDLNPLPNLRVFITGGATGIGRATAEAYAARNARICILDRVAVPDAPEDWVCIQGSATSAEDTEAAFARMDRLWGGVDVAFANAGMAANKPSLDLTETDWQRVLDLNLTGVFLTCQAAGRRMVPAGSGLILATSSIYGLTAGANRLTPRRRRPWRIWCGRWPSSGGRPACASMPSHRAMSKPT